MMKTRVSLPGSPNIRRHRVNITVYIPLGRATGSDSSTTIERITAGLVTMFAVPVLIILYWARKGRDPKLVKTVRILSAEGHDASGGSDTFTTAIRSAISARWVVYSAKDICA